jgi:peptide/nickel transport system permease protein
MLIVTMITFALLRMIPGNVAVMGTNAYRDPGAIKVFNADYGFNPPWYRQYFLWLGNLARGNLGFSWTLNQSVASLMLTALPKTLALVGLSTLLALVVAIPMGIVQAVIGNLFADVAYAVPDPRVRYVESG